MANSTRFQEVSMEQIERVRTMHAIFSDGSEFSFNYNTLLLVASILAGLGLASNSSTTIIASMLVSPIMGPVVGMAYGATIQDWRLFRRAFKTEMLSLLICVLMGIVLGLCTGWTDLGDHWPVAEMSTRATWTNFMVALPVAFFSGLGVAVSLLDDQTSSLVGVAISASLLPPAVNAGILLVAYGFFETNRLGMVDAIEDDAEAINHLLSVDMYDFWMGAVISLLLTVANVLLIIVSAMLMFRLKEVRLDFLIVLFVFTMLLACLLACGTLADAFYFSFRDCPSRRKSFGKVRCLKLCFVIIGFICYMLYVSLWIIINWPFLLLLHSFATDLGVARKIYSGLAVMAPEEQEASAAAAGGKEVGLDQIHEELAQTRSEEEQKEVDDDETEA
jgi:uncharacterized hydrophobic protein (TIGR00271 family)